MKNVRNYSGWAAVVTVTVTLTLVLFTVDKHLTKTASDLWKLSLQKDYSPWTSYPSDKHGGNDRQLQVELAKVELRAPNRMVNSAVDRRRDPNAHSHPSTHLRRPPEPASGAVLREPLTPEDFVTLPLTHGASSIGLLMDSMDAALASPLRMVSSLAERDDQSIDSTGVESAPQSAPGSPVEQASRFPVPVQLLHELAQLQQSLQLNHAGQGAESSPRLTDFPTQRYVATGQINHSHREELEGWLDRTRLLLQPFVTGQDWTQLSLVENLRELQQLAARGMSLGDQLNSDHVAQSWIRTSYSIQRRAEVWDAVLACQDHTTSDHGANHEPGGSRNPNVAIVQLNSAIAEVESLLARTSDAEAWRKFLLLDELSDWTKSTREEWRVGNELAKRFLDRVHGHQLDQRQQQFLHQEVIQHLTILLSHWNRDPVDYTRLLASIEQVEQAPDSRMATAIAEAIQSMGTAASPKQRELAEVLNRHYRNANLRLTVSRDLVERFMPQEQSEIRPVRQTILGARTSGDSTIQTKLSVRFHPHPSAWNLELGVTGDVVSNTSSSKGPAVFHNTGFAQVQSRRFLKIDAEGYTLSSSPTAVESQDFLNRMSTDFDGLPIIGEFARLIAREQFNQKRGIAKRITQRKIAQETDSELDKKLEENIKLYEQQLQQRLLGPLNRLRLDPTVVSMSTTEERLAIRYRLAHDSQLSSFAPRPRAPSDSLLSFQVHQSALNNTLERLGLSGRSWTLSDFYKHLGSLFQAPMTPPEDVPEDITVRFADRSPILVEMVDGHLRLSLRIAEFKREEGLQVRNFMVTSTYIPLADGLDAGLIRDPHGVIEIQGKNLAIRDRLALRVIFAKVFVSQPKISLISQLWQEDPKAKGMAISQLDIRDGWMAVALSADSSEMAAELAERTRQTKLQAEVAASAQAAEYR